MSKCGRSARDAVRCSASGLFAPAAAGRTVAGQADRLAVSLHHLPSYSYLTRANASSPARPTTKYESLRIASGLALVACVFQAGSCRPAVGRPTAAPARSVGTAMRRSLRCGQRTIRSQTWHPRLARTPSQVAIKPALCSWTVSRCIPGSQVADRFAAAPQCLTSFCPPRPGPGPGPCRPRDRNCAGRPNAALTATQLINFPRCEPHHWRVEERDGIWKPKPCPEHPPPAGDRCLDDLAP